MIRPVTLRPVLSRLSFALGLVAAAISVATAATGGGRFDLAGFRLSLTSPWRPALAALILCALYPILTPRAWRADLRACIAALPAQARAAAIALASVTAIAGWQWGAHVAGGADASGCVSQALSWSQGQLVVDEPIAEESPWPDAARTWAPLGYRTSESRPFAMVPTYPPGLPLLMAGFQLVAGFCGAFLVVPLCGGLVIWLTYRLGRQFFDSAAIALWAAALVATSPAFLYQLMNPMSDVPVTTAWTLALVLLIARRPFAAGLALSAAIAIRPNLIPVVIVPLAWMAIQDRRSAIRVGIGLMPAVVGIALLNAHLYGSPLRAGYGRASDLYALGNVMPNVRLYSSWLFQAETPLVILATIFVAAPSWVGPARVRHARLLAGGMIAAVVLSYLFYLQFDSWTYLRFFLPVWPLLMVLTSGVVFAILRRMSPRALPILATLILIAAVWQTLATANRRFVFALGKTERRYADVARFMSDHTDNRAVMISMQHSGSLHLYTGRPTLRYDFLDPLWLDRAVDYLKATNRHPYIVLDHWERDAFRRRFAGASQMGTLSWMPIATLADDVYIFDASAPQNAMPASAIPSSAQDIWSCPAPRP